MKRNRLLLSVTVVMVILLSLYFLPGCKAIDNTGADVTEETSQTVEEDTENTDIETVEEVAEETVEDTEETVKEEVTEKIEVKDDFDNTVSLDAPAEKVVVFAPSVLEIISELGAMDKVIGVDNWSIDSGEPLAQGFEGFGDYQGFNMEKIAEAQPDLIIALSGNPQEDIDRLAELGVEVYVSESISFEETYESIEKVGILLGIQEEANVLAETLKDQVGAIFEKTKDIPSEERPTVFYEIFDEPLWSAGRETFIDDMIEKAGGLNIVAAEGLTGYAEYSLEKLIEIDPEVMIAGDGGMYEVRTEDFILGDSRFSSVDAVINERVYIVPENPVVRPNHNSIKGLEMFARAIHPDIFGEFMIIE